MFSRLPIYRSLPDPWRGRLGMRRARRWLQAVAHQRAHNARLAADAPVVCFWPMRPGPNASMSYVLARLGARIGHSPRGAALELAWHTGTWAPAASMTPLTGAALNRRCLDISKTTVDRAWAEVAGYSIAIDPLTTEGPIVVKPNENGLHAGHVVEGPLPGRQPGMVYQRLIDSREDDGRILHLRPVVLHGRILLTYAKWRPYPQWFKGDELTLPRTNDEYFTAAEQSQLLDFAARLGLDYGEIDVLRDRESRLIYVVDANRTPVRPKGLPRDRDDEAFGPQAEAFATIIR